MTYYITRESIRLPAWALEAPLARHIPDDGLPVTVATVRHLLYTAAVHPTTVVAALCHAAGLPAAVLRDFIRLSFERRLLHNPKYRSWRAARHASAAVHSEHWGGSAWNAALALAEARGGEAADAAEAEGRITYRDMSDAWRSGHSTSLRESCLELARLAEAAS